MANRYWNPAGAANWGDASVWSLTDGGTANQATPTASDDVFFTGTNVNNCTFASNTVAKSITSTGYTGEFHTSSLTTNSLTLSGNWTTTGTLTLYGNSAVNRLLVTSNVMGTARTISAGTIVTKWVDFRDITGAGTANWNLTLQATDSSGNCGGNLNITFTTGATQNFAYGGVDYKWSTIGNWGAGRVPLPQDDVTSTWAFTGSPTWLLDMPRLGRSLDFSGTSGTVTISMLATSSVFGSVTSRAGILYNVSTGYGYTFEGRGTYTYTTGGTTQTNTFFSMFGGTLNLQDAMTFAGSPSITHSYGTFNTNGYTLTMSSYIMSGSGVKALNYTNSTFNVNHSGTPFTTTASNTTITSTGSTLNINMSGAIATQVPVLGAYTYNKINFIGTNILAPTGNFITTDAVSITAPRVVTLASGSLTTVADFKAYGSVGNLVTLGATAGSTQPPVIKKTGGGAIQTEFISAQGVNVMPLPIDGLDFLGQATGGDYVTASNSAMRNQFYGATSYSVDGWIVVRSAGGNSSGRFLDKSNGSATAGGIFFVNSTYQLAITLGADGSLQGCTSVAGDVKQNTLMHVGFSWVSGAKPTAYINGVALATLSGTVSTTLGDDSAIPLVIGNRTAQDRTFDGKIYAMRTYRNIALTAANFLALSTAGVKASNPLGNATSEYLMNDGTGTTVTDSVGGVNGTLSGATWFAGQTWFTGNHSLPDGKGLNFGGQASAGDYVSAANSATANQIYGATSYSAEAWVIARSLGAASVGRILDKSNNSTVGFQFLITTGQFLRTVLYEGGTPKESVASNRILTYNVLHHVVATWTSGSAVKLYVDGTETTYSTNTTITTPGDESSNSLTIGNFSARTRTWDGIIYVTRIYRNIAPTSGNVTTLYNAGYKAVNPLGNATSEYLFNEGAGGVLTDRIAGVNGTITGSSWANQGWNTGEMPNLLPFF